MSAPRGSFERTAWVAITAVLATSLAWTAVVCAAVIAGTCAHCPPAALVIVRVAAHVAPVLVRAAAGPVLAAMLAAALLALVLARDGRPSTGRARHA